MRPLSSEFRRVFTFQQKEIEASNTPPDTELLRGTIKITAVAQVVIATAAAIGLIYLLKVVLVTVLISMLLAFALDPIVVLLTRVRVHRAVGAAVALLLLFGLALGTCIFFYNRAIDFAEELPKYSTVIRERLRKLQAEAEKLETDSRTIMPQPDGKQPIPVEVREGPRLTKILSADATQYRDLALAIGFVPFLIYFMLTWKSHVHSATLQIFPSEQRPAAYRTIGRISEMVRSFIVGNLIVGLLNAAVSIVIFW